MKKKANKQDQQILQNSKNQIMGEKCESLSKSYDAINPQRFQRALKKLDLDRLPDKIPCRQNQKIQIQQWVKNSISTRGNPSIFYISGIPGIGKTICVTQVLKKVELEYRYKKNNKFIYLNCFRLKNAKDIYIAMMKGLIREDNQEMLQENLLIQNSNKKKSIHIDSAKALYILNDYFQRQTSEHIKLQGSFNKIMVIDEFDYLQTKDFDVLYNIVEWIQRKKSHLIVIAISNTMDYSQRLPGKLQSRFGKTSVTFRQYTKEQLKQIVQSRLHQIPVFKPQAINFLCNKVARQSTDIRKVLHILRESISKYMTTQSKLFKPADLEYYRQNISIQLVEQTYRDIYKDVFTQSFAQFPPCYKKVLLVMACYFREQSQKIVYSYLQFLCGDMIKRTNQLRSILYDLRDLGLINFDHRVVTSDNRIDKNFTIDKQVEQQHIGLLIQVQKILIAKSSDLTQIKYPSYVIQKL